MQYAIIRSGGKQFRVEKDSTVLLPLIDQEIGATIDLDVLSVVGDDNKVRIGAPVVDGARVAATVVGHGRGPKLIVFKKKRRKQYKRTQGHRQAFTRVKIDSID